MNLLPLLLLCLSASVIAAQEYKRVCYYSNLAPHREGKAKCLPEDLNSTLCTHMILAYANIKDNKLVPVDTNDGLPKGLYEKFNNLRNISNVTTMLGVGGWTLQKNLITEMLKTKETIKVFTKSVCELLYKHGFGGIAIDFLNLGQESKLRLIEFFKELRLEFIEATKTGKPMLQIAVLIPGKKDMIDNVFDLKSIQEHIDIVNVMAFDLDVVGATVTGHHSALHPGPKTNKENTVEWLMNYLVGFGVPKVKLIMGVATYGEGFKLTDPTKYDIGAPITGPCPAGELLKMIGVRAYFEICTMIKDGTATKVFLPDEKVPYIYTKEGIWVGYDGTESLKLKVQWLKDNGFGGWMVNATDMDDFKGDICNEGPFPLLNTLCNALLVNETVTIPPLSEILHRTVSIEHTTGVVTTMTPVSLAPCTMDMENVKHKYSGDCKKYILCVNKVSKIEDCPAEKPYFDPVIKDCNTVDKLTPERKMECGL